MLREGASAAPAPCPAQGAESRASAAPARGLAPACGAVHPGLGFRGQAMSPGRAPGCELRLCSRGPRSSPPWSPGQARPRRCIGPGAGRAAAGHPLGLTQRGSCLTPVRVGEGAAWGVWAPGGKACAWDVFCMQWGSQRAGRERPRGCRPKRRHGARGGARTRVHVAHGVVAGVAHPAAGEHSGEALHLRGPPVAAQLHGHLPRGAAARVWVG